ncbi:flavodoxin [Photobacterium profundum]|uniref:Flavodoxin n=1 Tax=Photobacterium profundum 3TCK TaxID=314280 RepID=Q1Z083_9GAMM|nr:flavodoxin [Photobacterium profundum]EAS41940.1 flavodoxin [Photobacterium profundum 3TCK]PSV59175.1 flavodoxin [Photobacterium profundum]
MAKIGVFVGSVFGGAEDVAQDVITQLSSNGHTAQLYLDPQLDDFLAYQNDTIVVITSTTGQGEVPDNLLPLYVALNDQFPLMPKLSYGVISMGDSSYGEDRYCGAGRQFDEMLQQLQAKPVAERLDIDACVNFDALEAALPWLSRFLKQIV